VTSIDFCVSYIREFQWDKLFCQRIPRTCNYRLYGVLESIEATMEAERWKPQDLWANSTSKMMQLVGLWLLYRVALALYNISPFHPLSRFPGPKLAAMTFLYEFWYEGILWGKYTSEIQRMHEKYGTSLHVHY
jgi:hypothetical protein